MSIDTRSFVEQRVSYFVASFLAVFGATLSWFLYHKIHYITDYSRASYSPYLWPRRAALVPHIIGGTIASTCGLVQIFLGLTGRTNRLHRIIGRIYVGGILIASVAGFYLAVTIPKHIVYKTGLFMLCVAWVITTAMAVYFVYRKRFSQHREWMLRSYVVTFAFVTFRVGSTIVSDWGRIPNVPLGDIAALMAWACWSVPLLLAEPLIQLRSIKNLWLRAETARTAPAFPETPT
jgi:uncharacterized membrane protein